MSSPTPFLVHAVQSLFRALGTIPGRHPHVLGRSRGSSSLNVVIKKTPTKPEMLVLLVLSCVAHFAASHPQCLDSQPPFSGANLSFCSEYNDYGCCAKDLRMQRRVEVLLRRLPEERRSICEPFLRNTSCLECSPWAAHIFEAENANEERVFPHLCRSYCEEAYQKCVPVIMRYFRLKNKDFGVVSHPDTQQRLLEDTRRFCEAVVPEDSPYCYPRVLNGPFEGSGGSGTQPTSDLGCICGLPVATGLRFPVVATHSGDGTGRLFIVEMPGEIRILTADNTLLEEPFLNISSQVQIASRVPDERGLLGLAFHPDYRNNGRFYVYYSKSVRRQTKTKDHKSRVSEFQVRGDDPNKANANSERVILSIKQTKAVHNGGMLLFKDGYLLIFLGDGGGQRDKFEQAQDRSTFLGSVLRIDVDHQDPGKEYAIPDDNPFVDVRNVRPEIYAYGFRNPWRCSIDRGDRESEEGRGRVFCGDVGQASYEEVDIVERGGNYGWRAFEGNSCFDSNLCSSGSVANAVSPIDVYSHGIRQAAVIGGYVYRGCLFPNLRGLYIFGDYTWRLFVLNETSPGQWRRSELCMGDDSTCTGNLVGKERGRILSFGEDEDGELYILASSLSTDADGMVYQIVDPARREFPQSCQRNTRVFPAAV